MSLASIIAHRHPFGKVLQDVTQAASVADAMALGGLDFTVSKVELSSHLIGSDGVTNIEYPKHRGIVRTDTNAALAVVSDTYGVLQNSEVMAPLDYLMSEGIVSSIEQAGHINGGARVFMLANLSESTTITDDPHNRRILIATSHDGTGATTARGWLERVFCANQMPAMLSSKGAIYRIRHSSKAATYLKDFRSAVIAAVSSIQTLEDQISVLQQQRTTERDINWFVERMFPMKNFELMNTPAHLRTRGENVIVNRVTLNRDTLRNLITQSVTNENVRGTRAALFHSAVEFSDYYAGGKRAERMLAGRDVAFKAKALTLAGSI